MFGFMHNSEEESFMKKKYFKAFFVWFVFVIEITLIFITFRMDAYTDT